MNPVAAETAQARLSEASQFGGDAALHRKLRNLVDCIQQHRSDQADNLYRQMCEEHPSARQMLVFPVVIAIQKGQAVEALRHINSLPEDRCPELRALCLCMAGDPTWHGEATALLDSPDPAVVRAMRKLLGETPGPDPLQTH